MSDVMIGKFIHPSFESLKKGWFVSLEDVWKRPQEVVGFPLEKHHPSDLFREREVVSNPVPDSAPPLL